MHRGKLAIYTRWKPGVKSRNKKTWWNLSLRKNFEQILLPSRYIFLQKHGNGNFTMQKWYSRSNTMLTEKRANGSTIAAMTSTTEHCSLKKPWYSTILLRFATLSAAARPKTAHDGVLSGMLIQLHEDAKKNGAKQCALERRRCRCHAKNHGLA